MVMRVGAVEFVGKCMAKAAVHMVSNGLSQSSYCMIDSHTVGVVTVTCR